MKYLLCPNQPRSRMMGSGGLSILITKGTKKVNATAALVGVAADGLLPPRTHGDESTVIVD